VHTCIRIYIVHRCTVHKENLYTVDSTGMICGSHCSSDLYLYVNLNQHLFTYCLDLRLEDIVPTCIRMYIVHRCTVHKENLYIVDSTGMICMWFSMFTRPLFVCKFKSAFVYLLLGLPTCVCCFNFQHMNLYVHCT
jgi:hypothetical protein